MTAVRVFDPAMCCSTGICGPSVDPQLIRFAADLEWLMSQGVSVERFNLSQQPAAFADDTAVKTALETKGEAGLPLVKVDGEVKSIGTYPSRYDLAQWTGVGAPASSIFTEAVSELVAIGAAVASNCEPCFKLHYDQARKLGVSREDMLRAATIARSVVDSPRRSIDELARRYLSRETVIEAAGDENPEASPKAKSIDCCGPASKFDGSSQKKSGCC